MQEKNKGMTLVEFMLISLIVNILLLVSLPAYDKYIRDSHSSGVQSQMLGISNDLDRLKVKHYTYKAALNPDGTFNESISQLRYPININEDVRFNISVIDVQDDSYKIVATPTAVQSSNYGKLTLTYRNSELIGLYDQYNNDTWSVRWY